ncbi:hypothetical protein [Ferruginivarius sediminum]|uniref:hypothetical protein n=1 Tax=Ferruginivarius sediminum TaxID=2661937 RepID=UPI001F4EEC55|nr:hypothetical protein [Ferruginivarius sediminum]
MSAETLGRSPEQQNSVTSEDRRITCFSLRAAVEPGVMPRVLELFAKRNLVPDRWHSDVVGTARDELSIDLQVSDLTPETGAYIARCLRQIWGVEAVLTSEKRFA